LFSAGTTSFDGYYWLSLRLTGKANLKFTVFGMEADDLTDHVWPNL
jgi:hypothetical protein